MGNKTCAECGIDQTVSNFYRDKSRKDGFARVCKPCDKARLQKRYYENQEESRARSKRWHRENKARRSEYDRAKYASNKEQKLARSAAWRSANPERMAAFKKKWQQANPERYAMQKRANESKRRARKASVQILDFTEHALAARLAYYGNKCWICKTAPYEALDHVKPLSKGGAHMLSNLRPACASCNNSKHANWPYLPKQIQAA